MTKIAQRIANAVIEFKCDDECGWRGTNPDGDDPSGELYCPDCGGVVQAGDDRNATWVSIARYDISRAYGGPEEGGWYYDEGTRLDDTLRCFDVYDSVGLLEASLYYERLLNESDCDFPPRVYLERVAPKNFPESRPFYC